jgi:flagellar biosynthesis anti-sigma factor FlgM
MSSINNIGSSSPVQKIVQSPVQRSLPADETAAPTRPSDRLELTGNGQYLQSLKANDVRTDKVQTIKSQIEAGTYETDEKLNATLDKILDELNK